MSSFGEVRELLEHYYCVRLSTGMSRLAEHLLQEVRGRLRQMQWAHQRMLQIEAQIDAASISKLPKGEAPAQMRLYLFTDAVRPACDTLIHARSTEQPQDELRCLLESYYYSAHRIRVILQDNRDDLPGVNGFEAVGVRNVRNHLVEHPTGQSGVVVSSIKCGGPVGPQLKPIRWSLDEPGTADAGLHSNTTEFLDNLDRTLRIATSSSAA